MKIYKIDINQDIKQIIEKIIKIFQNGKEKNLFIQLEDSDANPPAIADFVLFLQEGLQEKKIPAVFIIDNPGVLDEVNKDLEGRGIKDLVFPSSVPALKTR